MAFTSPSPPQGAGNGQCAICSKEKQKKWAWADFLISPPRSKETPLNSTPDHCKWRRPNRNQKKKIWTRAHRSHNPLLTCHQKLYSRSQTKMVKCKTCLWLAGLTYPPRLSLLDKKPFAQLGTSDVLKVLKPIWHTKHETARKVQNRIKLIFGYAKAEGLYEKDNPAIWQDHLCNFFPILKGVHQVKHHRALDYKYAPSFFAELMAIETMTSKALQFTTLTAARTNETLGATAQEFDLTKRVWRVPAERMKARKTHDVPLSDQACCLLDGLFRSHNVHYIFHGRNPGKPLSNMAMLTLIKKRLHTYDTTVHGLRSTFRTWAGEATNYNPGIIEFALAHRLDEKTEGAYFRSELLKDAYL